MNFLGHLYFSNNDTELMLYNLFGDFVKGSHLSHFPSEVEYGIRLHREIDFYIDTHPLTLDLMHALQTDLPKVSGIAIDLYFDHLLAKNWINFHSKPLNVFLEEFYASINLEKEYFTKEFKQMITKLLEQNWIQQYTHLTGLEKACIGVSNRLSFPNTLLHGRHFFEKTEEKITQTFQQFMVEACEHFSIWNSK